MNLQISALLVAVSYLQVFKASCSELSQVGSRISGGMDQVAAGKDKKNKVSEILGSKTYFLTQDEKVPVKNQIATIHQLQNPSEKIKRNLSGVVKYDKWKIGSMKEDFQDLKDLLDQFKKDHTSSVLKFSSHRKRLDRDVKALDQLHKRIEEALNALDTIGFDSEKMEFSEKVYSKYLEDIMETMVHMRPDLNNNVFGNPDEQVEEVLKASLPQSRNHLLNLWGSSTTKNTLEDLGKRLKSLSHHSGDGRSQEFEGKIAQFYRFKFHIFKTSKKENLNKRFKNCSRL
ncbi:hypothetical protein PGT21_015239 [Puccinia graminis f. sp. tritici]|uniref:Uncharacterized protein n=1 Tax=Puccinia graminis f. sp. tritici TaxID=56615 RepID=A0A5B0ML04_PUCGR|nr:hypothetical protein PGT21_015239 [Puccinia graminis f. sp. tritici]